MASNDQLYPRNEAEECGVMLIALISLFFQKEQKLIEAVVVLTLYCYCCFQFHHRESNRQLRCWRLLPVLKFKLPNHRRF